MITFAASWSPQFTLGNLVTVTLVILAGIAAFYRIRALPIEQAEKSAEWWQGQVEPLKEVIDELRKQLTTARLERDEQRRLKHECRAELVAERMKGDQTPIIQALADQTEALRGDREATEQFRREVTEHMEATIEVLSGLVANISDLNSRRRTGDTS